MAVSNQYLYIILNNFTDSPLVTRSKGEFISFFNKVEELKQKKDPGCKPKVFRTGQIEKWFGGENGWHGSINGYIIQRFKIPKMFLTGIGRGANLFQNKDGE